MPYLVVDRPKIDPCQIRCGRRCLPWDIAAYVLNSLLLRSFELFPDLLLQLMPPLFTSDAHSRFPLSFSDGPGELEKAGHIHHERAMALNATVHTQHIHHHHHTRPPLHAHHQHDHRPISFLEYKLVV